jgi:glycosyltransferase involved in cell wall biosynthesis
MNLPFVSIIIPTYNDWQRLALCLNSLAKQSYDQSSFEIIVVNNNAKDSQPIDLVLPINCKLLTEGKPGSYAARNAALKIADGEIIGFTDSDCIIDKDWIRNAVAIFEKDSSTDRIGGAIEIFFKAERPTKVELHDKIFAFPQESCVKGGYAVTGNMYSRRTVFDAIGLFDDTLMSGGDYQWGMLAQKNNFKIVFGRDVIVNHPARDSLKELVTKERRIGKGQANFTQFQKTGTKKVLIELFRLCKPRTWEIKKIFEQGRDLSLPEKISVIVLRHYIKISGDLNRIYHTNKKKNI